MRHALWQPIGRSRDRQACASAVKQKARMMVPAPEQESSSLPGAAEKGMPVKVSGAVAFS
jgi:hypothetical protein